MLAACVREDSATQARVAGVAASPQVWQLRSVKLSSEGQQLWNGESITAAVSPPQLAIAARVSSFANAPLRELVRRREH
jgi:hypothetical protein